jgi:hypothetical protein
MGVAGFVLGVLVTTVAGAALGSHAAGDGGAALESPPEDTPVVAETAKTTPEPAYGVFDRLAACESSGRWSVNTGNGYFGGLQQDLVFWRRYGGLAYAPRPDLASRAAQIAVAQRGLSVQGWKAWPACARALGLR